MADPTQVSQAPLSEPETSSQPMELFSPLILEPDTPVYVICKSAIQVNICGGGTVSLAANTPAKFEAPNDSHVIPSS
jgi:hypothetical protein